MEQKHEQHILRVEIVQGKGIKGRDKVGKGDPYVIFSFAGQRKQTLHRNNTADPVFQVVCGTMPKNRVAVVSVYDKNVMKDKLIGSFDVVVGQTQEYAWYDVRRDGVVVGRLQIRLRIEKVEEKVDTRYLNYTHIVEIKICEGKGFPKMDLLSKSDPYIAVQYGTACFRTSTAPRGDAPTWNQKKYLFVNQADAEEYDIFVSCLDEDAKRDDIIGVAYYDSKELYEGNKIDTWLKLSGSTVQSDKDLENFNRTNDGMAEQTETELKKTRSFFKKKKATVDKKKNLGSVRIEAIAHPKSKIEKDFFQWVLKEFNKDEDNELDRDEARLMITTIAGQDGFKGEDLFNQWFDSVDENKNGKIEEKELVKFMSSASFQKSGFLGKLLSAYLSGEFDPAGAYLMSGITKRTATSINYGPEQHQLTIFDRKNGLYVKENIPAYIRTSLNLMFSSKIGRFFTSVGSTPKILNSLSVRQGKKYDDPASAKDIPGFVKLHDLDTECLEKKVSEFKTMNEFFARALKDGARPPAEPKNKKVLLSPADCRLSAFQEFSDSTKFWVKGKNFTIENLLQDAPLARKMLGGVFVIARLAPQDYHRFHFPCDCTVKKVTPIDGALYTVNPIAINSDVDVYTLNKRCIIELDSPQFGTVVLVAVAATMVGSYNLFFKVGDKKQRGDLCGEFRFGGSTVLVLCQKGAVTLDPLLIRNSSAEKPIETLLRCNSRIGEKK